MKPLMNWKNSSKAIAGDDSLKEMMKKLKIEKVCRKLIAILI